MDCKECMTKMIARQTEGVVYHSDMADYYRFLCLDSFKKMHEHRSEEELCKLNKLKDCYDKIYSAIPRVTMTQPEVIPKDWYNKTSMEISKGSVKSLGKDSLMHWLAWEKATLDIYKECAKFFKENMAFHQLKIASKMIKEVSGEISCIEGILEEGLSYDFEPEFMKNYIPDDDD